MLGNISQYLFIPNINLPKFFNVIKINQKYNWMLSDSNRKLLNHF